MFDERQKEIRTILEDIAEESMKEWTEKEKIMTKETGMILDYSLRSRTCRICVTARRMNKIPNVHVCRKNYSGSSKAMESDMVIQMQADARAKGTNIMTIVGDEVATTIARLRTKVDKDIKKLSDSNHIKKTLGKSLFALRNKHSHLTTKIIYYLIKCFNLLVAQARGRPEEIEKNLLALSSTPWVNIADAILVGPSLLKTLHQITPKAEEITGMTFENGQLLSNGNVLPAVRIKNCLNDFIYFLEKTKNNVLIGHNVQTYDCMLLYTSLQKCNLLDKFKTTGIGFIDTLLLFKLFHPGPNSYSQTYMFETFMGKSYDAHRADEDVDALCTLLNKNIELNVNFEKVYKPEFVISDKFSSMKELHKHCLL
ncbi:unnamed protein product [Mytilus coruscus]|uniref:Mutator-like transposase domain-containing protein n=1 Tax=Mytilus coruscus TaxID=42192 RepID=A0A6J8B951_MYTCO|nr:unnamed protein product [Mytilus coruscus]